MRVDNKGEKKISPYKPRKISLLKKSPSFCPSLGGEGEKKKKPFCVSVISEWGCLLFRHRNHPVPVIPECLNQESTLPKTKTFGFPIKDFGNDEAKEFIQRIKTRLPRKRNHELAMTPWVRPLLSPREERLISSLPHKVAKASSTILGDYHAC